jgi:hypothetical protein
LLRLDFFERPARFGKLFRFVLANSSSCFLLIEEAMLLEAPLSKLLDFSPRLAPRAAPAAICCFFDFAGIYHSSLLTLDSVLPFLETVA